MKNNMKVFLILSVLSLLNWFPVIGFWFLHTPKFLSEPLLFLSYCSPFTAVLYIITAIHFTAFKGMYIRRGSVIIVINTLYLIWSEGYLLGKR